MVVTINLLHIFGLAKPIAAALNAQKGNQTLWNVVQGVGLFLALSLFIPLVTLVVGLTNGSFSPFSFEAITIPTLIMVELITIETTAVAGWYREGCTLIRYPGGSWVMLKIS